MRRITAFIIAAAIFLSPLVLSAEETDGRETFNVTVRTEAQNGSLGGAAVQAENAFEAVSGWSALTGYAVEFAEDGSVLTVGGQGGANGDSSLCVWICYIQRGAQIIKTNDLSLFVLEENDEVILFFGSPIETAILTDFSCEATPLGLQFFTGVTHTGWALEDETWVEQKTTEPVSGVTIRIALPNGYSVAVLTDENGTAFAEISAKGYVKYFAEGPREDGPPVIARTSERSIFFGAAQDSQVDGFVTRAQALVFWIEALGLQKNETEFFFTDVDPEADYFAAVETAASIGLVAGYGDGTFRPERRITLLELCVIMTKLFHVVAPADAAVEDVPAWGVHFASAAVHAGWLGEDADWNGYVSANLFDSLAMVVMNGK
ncbi:MAG: S-layer homology domain-containing protein [Defluviitaleaceae bacterium]|nr:S-layer homology domain-containing protein [Defluviitaleaceae bacterium]